MTLILISDFMQDEIYLNEESNYYGAFNKVIFFSVKGHKYSNKTLQMHKNMICGQRDIFYKNTFDKLKCLLKGVFNHEGINELKYIFLSKKASFFTLKSYALFTAKATMLLREISKTLSEMQISPDEKIVFYSYRLGIGTFVSHFLQKKYHNSKIISRTHGQDIFSFRNKYDYLPYRDLLYKAADKIYCISADGKKYIDKKYSSAKNKTTVFRLGTRNIDFNKNISNNPFIIVSCSRIARIKRLHLLADALSDINDKNILWIHYGDGDIRYLEEIKSICNNFPENIKVEFKGFINNKSLAEIYSKNKLSVFINLSESEGLPVSIMEACSAGLPVIATDVGGTSEIIHHKKNGYLLSKDFTKDDLIQVLYTFMNMEPDDFNLFRLSSREIWSNDFSSQNNYKSFINDITKLF